MINQNVVNELVAIHNEDPCKLAYQGQLVSKSYIKHKLLNEWMGKVTDAPTEALIYAAWAQHIKRYMFPRNEYPEGKAGYLKWRNDMKDRHFKIILPILEKNNIDADTIERVRKIIYKENLKGNPESQAMEDALCLVFLSWEIDEFIDQSDINDEKIVDIIAKTAKKMGPKAIELAKTIQYSPHVKGLMGQALQRLAQ